MDVNAIFEKREHINVLLLETFATMVNWLKIIVEHTIYL